MASFLPMDVGKILEPTPGKGNLVNALLRNGNVYVPEDFDLIEPSDKFDWIVMNPPFSPMKQGYEILYRCMDLTNNIIALMPYLTIINGEKRTHLPRSTFKGSRVQTCILEMERGYNEATIFKTLPK